MIDASIPRNDYSDLPDEVMLLFLEEILADLVLSEREKHLLIRFCRWFKISEKRYYWLYEKASDNIKQRGAHPGAFNDIAFYLELEEFVQDHPNRDRILISFREFLGLDPLRIPTSRQRKYEREQILETYLREVITDRQWSEAERLCLSDLIRLLKISNRRYLTIYNSLCNDSLIYDKDHLISDEKLFEQFKLILDGEANVGLLNTLKSILEKHFDKMPAIPNFTAEDFQVEDNTTKDVAKATLIKKESDSERWIMQSHNQYLDYQKLVPRPRELHWTARLQLLLRTHCLFFICLLLPIVFSLFPLRFIDMGREWLAFSESGLGQTTGTIVRVSRARNSMKKLIRVDYVYYVNDFKFEGYSFVTVSSESLELSKGQQVEVEYRYKYHQMSRIIGHNYHMTPSTFYYNLYLCIALGLIICLLYFKKVHYLEDCLTNGLLRIGTVIGNEKQNGSEFLVDISQKNSQIGQVIASNLSQSLITSGDKVLVFSPVTEGKAILWEGIKPLIKFEKGQLVNKCPKLWQELGLLGLIMPVVFFFAVQGWENLFPAVDLILGVVVAVLCIILLSLD